jgi:MtrB/PioB family decaheme-associated outer membrane protein
MKTKQQAATLKVSVYAVRGVLMAMALVPIGQVALAAEDESAVTALTKPSSSVEIGVQNVDHDSAKFGEYNGLEKKGTTAIGNFDLRGGGDNDAGSTTRYRLRGRDLGLETRSVDGEFGQQGSFRLNFGYDELQRYRSDSYQTPYQGAGSSLLILPQSWIVPTVPAIGPGFNARGLSSAVTSAPALVAGAVRTPSAANLATAATLQANDLPMFHHVDLYTRRQAESAGFSTILTPQWEITGSVRHERKTGMKPMGALSILAPTNNEVSTPIPDLIRQTHNEYKLAANYHDASSTVSLAYYGSTFENDVKDMQWSDWSAPLATRGLSTISSAPDNRFHQLNLTGTHNYSAATRLVVNVAYGRNTQNQSFISDSTDTLPAGVTSLHGEVISKTFNLKLTSHVTRDLTLGGTLKYDERDNRTPVNTYQYSDAQQTVAPPSGNPFPGVVVAQNANANRPYSKKVDQASLDADYRLSASQAIKGGYDWQKTERYCNGSWIACADAATTKDNTLRVEWRSSLLEDVSGRVGYAYSMRRVNLYNENAFLALVPFANVVPAGATTSAYGYLLSSGLNGWGPAAGYAVLTGNAGAFFPANNALANAKYANANRISELPGMRRYNMADRNRDKLRAGLDWRAGDKWSWQGGFEYNNDDYFNSTYGLQQGSGWALNVDGTFAASETFTASVFASREEQRQTMAGNSYTANSATSAVNGFTAISGGCYATIGTRNRNNKIDPCLNWSNDMRDTLDTVGLSFQQKGLLKERLELGGDLTFSRARTDNYAYGGNYVNNPLAVAGAPAGTIAAFYVPASNLPTVSTNTVQLRLNGSYHIDKASSVRLGYGYARMKSNDYAYDGMQPGGLTAVLPSYESAPSYVVHLIAASYNYTFQ